MNKVFLVVFLGVVVGAMALILFNQTSVPETAVAPSGRQRVADAGLADTSFFGRAGEGGQQAGEARQRLLAAAASQNQQTQDASREISRGEKPANMDKPELTLAAPAPSGKTQPEQADSGQSKPESVKSAQTAVSPVKPETPVMPEPAKSAQPSATPASPQSAVIPAKPVTPAKSVTPPKPDPKRLITLRAIGLHFKGNGVALRVEADGPFSYKTFVLSSPDRYVVDLTGNWSGMRAPSVPSNKLVKDVRVGIQAGGPRLVLDMSRPPQKHNLVWISDTVLEIQVE